MAVGQRQSPMTKKRLQILTETPENMDEETKLRFNRNKQMIDLSMIPEQYTKQILEEFNKEKEVGREKLFNFFVKMKLKNLITDIQDF